MGTLMDQDEAALFSEESLCALSSAVKQNLDILISKRICQKLGGDLKIVQQNFMQSEVIFQIRCFKQVTEKIEYNGNLTSNTDRQSLKQSNSVGKLIIFVSTCMVDQLVLQVAVKNLKQPSQLIIKDSVEDAALEVTLLFHGSFGLYFGGLVLIDSNLFDNNTRQLRKAIKSFKKSLEEAGVKTFPKIAFICN